MFSVDFEGKVYLKAFVRLLFANCCDFWPLTTLF